MKLDNLGRKNLEEDVPQETVPGNRIETLIWSLYLPALIHALSRGILLPVLPLFALELGESYGSVGLVVAGEGIGALIGAIPAGKVLQRFGRRVSMLLGCSTIGFASLFLAFAESVLEAFAICIFTGIGSGIFNISCHGYLAETVAVHKRGKAIATYGGVNRIGLLIGPALGGWIGSNAGLRIPFLFCGIAEAVTFILVLLFVARVKVNKDSSEPGGKKTGDLLKHIRLNLGSYLPIAGGAFLFQAMRSARAILIPLFGVDNIGLDIDEVGYVLSISNAMDSSLFLFAGFLMDRFGRKAAILPSVFILAMGIGLLGMMDCYLGFIIASLLIGLGNGIGSGTMLTLSADIAPTEFRGEFFGYWRLVNEGARLGSHATIGGVGSWFSLTAAALLIATGGLVGFILFAFYVRETLVKNRKT
ncbi:MAG: Tetracycline resistance protein, class B [Candidatus Moanabacter tarae]|uniref:Tetracycline resistance protein, class B n=1 Tax=Candidatus Moanibacter tarae TaxID=2200854 RepID=A0A2Z4APG4_9BACT|nr:MAG: Tetracycline resistance protein, class B [Candidatus Moanabacter tarae]